MGEPTYRVIFDRDDMRPYCVLLQAAMGGDHYAVTAIFDAQFWHTAPTENPVYGTFPRSALVKHNKRLRDLALAGDERGEK